MKTEQVCHKGQQDQSLGATVLNYVLSFSWIFNHELQDEKETLYKIH